MLTQKCAEFITKSEHLQDILQDLSNGGDVEEKDDGEQDFRLKKMHQALTSATLAVELDAAGDKDRAVALYEGAVSLLKELVNEVPSFYVRKLEKLISAYELRLNIFSPEVFKIFLSAFFFEIF